MSKLLETINQKRRLIEEAEEWFNNREPRYRELLLQLDGLGCDVTLCWEYGKDINITCSGDKHKLAAIVRAIRTCGFEGDNAPPKKGQSSWAAFYHHKVDATATLYLSFSSTVCRRVKVGTKTVEQDVYETVCDELVMPADAA